MTTYAGDMIVADEALDGRDAILAATGRHPFVRHSLPDHAPARGWRRAGAVGWLLTVEHGPIGGVIGAAEPAIDLVGAVAAAGRVGAGRWVHLPRTDPAPLGPAVTGHEDWDFLWTTGAPPTQPGEDRVVRLTEADHPALTALIDEAFPTSTARPGDPSVRHWYGIRDADRLIACGADRTRGEVGFLAGLTVAPRHRGRGLGATITAGMTRVLLARYDMVALGVYPSNLAAIRLYRRLGYTGTLPLTSVRFA
ncbi:GNAT family N-acetyltransferase [Verrucosispora sp. WMMA2121]|uniref:GNAT family N-acetyltransferase n=1 Tax=Verrucosispora sp. WMMA2121 TaxID=3015164 RepID=UPI0022B7544D|nr:GNAT family N-acetyltransferase [Verrucosispora sp. WMMA2121]MCZ7419720.1 GNAT family N-acetyltransferase [Verrucosispora sp. WMMA2121]